MWLFFSHVWQIFSKPKKSQNAGRILTQKQLDCQPVCKEFSELSWFGWPGTSTELPVKSFDNILPQIGFWTIYDYFITIKTNNDLFSAFSSCRRLCKTTGARIVHMFWVFFLNKIICQSWKKKGHLSPILERPRQLNQSMIDKVSKAIVFWFFTKNYIIHTSASLEIRKFHFFSAYSTHSTNSTAHVL